MEQKEKNIKKHLSKRIGETHKMSNGQEAKVIAYRSCNDIDIQFEDGIIRNGVKYGHFKNGQVSPFNLSDKNRHIGKRKTMNCGDEAEIIAYRSNMDIDIRFNDGTIVTTQYGAFRNGMVQKNKKKHYDTSRIGETVKARNGQMMKIVAYRKSNDIDVEFADGTIVTNVSYGTFLQGQIRNPNIPHKRVGEKNKNNDGKWMTIIAYRNSVNMDVQFEDGKIREHVQYRSFQRGEIKHPDDSHRKIDNE